MPLASGRLVLPARILSCRASAVVFARGPQPVDRAQGESTKATDSIIDSWGSRTSEGCSINTLQAARETQAAAGIMMVVAAVNTGWHCSLVTDPPSFYAAYYAA